MSSSILTVATYDCRLSSSSLFPCVPRFFRSRSSLRTALWDMVAAWSAVKPSGRRNSSITDAQMSPVRLIPSISTVVIVDFNVQLLPGLLERLPDGLDVGRSTVRSSSETSGQRNVSRFSPEG